MNCGLIPTFVSCTNCTNQTEGGVSGSLRAAIIRSRAGTSWNLIGRPCCAISTGIKVWLRVEYLSLTEQLISFTHPPRRRRPACSPTALQLARDLFSFILCLRSSLFTRALCLSYTSGSWGGKPCRGARSKRPTQRQKANLLKPAEK